MSLLPFTLGQYLVLSIFRLPNLVSFNTSTRFFYSSCNSQFEEQRISIAVLENVLDFVDLMIQEVVDSQSKLHYVRQIVGIQSYRWKKLPHPPHPLRTKHYCQYEFRDIQSPELLIMSSIVYPSVRRRVSKFILDRSCYESCPCRLFRRLSLKLFQ